MTGKKFVYFTVSEFRENEWLATRCTREEILQALRSEIELIYPCRTKQELNWKASKLMISNPFMLYNDDPFTDFSTFEVNEVDAKMDNERLLLSHTGTFISKFELMQKVFSRARGWPKFKPFDVTKWGECKEAKETKFKISEIEQLLKEVKPEVYELKDKAWIGTRSEIFNKKYEYKIQSGSWKVYHGCLEQQSFIFAIHNGTKEADLRFERITNIDDTYGLLSENDYKMTFEMIEDEILMSHTEAEKHLDNIITSDLFYLGESDESFTLSDSDIRELYLYMSRNDKNEVNAFLMKSV